MDGLAKKRLALLIWLAVAVSLALEPLQWRDAHRLIYVAGGVIAVIAQLARCTLQWNKCDA